MNRLILHRVSDAPDCSAGVFINGQTGLPVIVSLELPWRQNKTDISCIPCRTYICSPHKSPKLFESGHTYKRFSDFNCYIVEDVVDRKNILIHAANWVRELRGCIAPGTAYVTTEREFAVGSSRAAMQKIIDLFGTQKFLLTIR